MVVRGEGIFFAGGFTKQPLGVEGNRQQDDDQTTGHPQEPAIQAV